MKGKLTIQITNQGKSMEILYENYSLHRDNHFFFFLEYSYMVTAMRRLLADHGAPFVKG